MKCTVTVGDMTLVCEERFEDGKHLHKLTVEEAAVAPHFPAKHAVKDNLSEVDACKAVGSFLVLTDGPDPEGEFYRMFPEFGED